ncbi:unnamed protein product [Diabrotica balteata]|uniref:THAP-type domain-containing protein n=1 Tax=Diabrotica balteata TaxID=107213 RepID=A0A9N9T0A8_DIABA|nr:unnamed protein product [Diabrotica balteata]
MTSISKNCCSVPQCSSYYNSQRTISLHKFPLDENMRKVWQCNLRIGKPITKHMNVCSLHFTDNDYFPITPETKLRRLKKNAIPSAKLPQRSHEVTSRKRKTPRERINTELNNPIIFPVGKKTKTQWIKNMKMSDRIPTPNDTTLHIVQEHQTKYSKRRLKEDLSSTSQQENSQKKPLMIHLPEILKGKQKDTSSFLVESENTTDMSEDEMFEDERNPINGVIEQLKGKCRTCLIRNGTTDLFTSKHDGILLCDLLSNFSLTEVLQSDGLPKTVCSHCSNFIINAYTFKKQVEKSLITLKSAIYQLGSLKIEGSQSPMSNPKGLTKSKRVSKECKENHKRKNSSKILNDTIERIDNDKCGSENNSAITTTKSTFVKEYEYTIKSENSDTKPEKLIIRTYDENDNGSNVETQSDVDELIKIEVYNDTDESTESENELQSKMTEETIIGTYQDKNCRNYIRNYMKCSRLKKVSKNAINNTIDKKHILKYSNKDTLEIVDESSQATFEVDFEETNTHCESPNFKGVLSINNTNLKT